MIDRADDTIKVVKPSIDVAAPGAEAVTSKTLDEALMKVKGPKVVSFDITDTNPPGQLGITSVPTVYLFKKTGEAIEFPGDVADADAIMAFATGKKAAAALVQKTEPVHKCKLENCVVKSKLASAG